MCPVALCPRRILFLLFLFLFFFLRKSYKVGFQDIATLLLFCLFVCLYVFIFQEDKNIREGSLNIDFRGIKKNNNEPKHGEYSLQYRQISL